MTLVESRIDLVARAWVDLTPFVWSKYNPYAAILCCRQFVVATINAVSSVFPFRMHHMESQRSDSFGARDG